MSELWDKTCLTLSDTNWRDKYIIVIQMDRWPAYMGYSIQIEGVLYWGSLIRGENWNRRAQPTAMNWAAEC